MIQREYLKEIVKYGGEGSIITLDCMSANGLGNLVRIEGIIHKEQYEKILNEKVKKLKMGSFVFQQDNDSKHTAGNISEWFVKNRINTFK